MCYGVLCVRQGCTLTVQYKVSDKLKSINPPSHSIDYTEMIFVPSWTVIPQLSHSTISSPSSLQNNNSYQDIMIKMNTWLHKINNKIKLNLNQHQLHELEQKSMIECLYHIDY